MTIAPPPQAASTSVAVHQLGGLFDALGEAAIVVAADGTVANANQRTLQLCNDGEIPTTLDAWLRCEDGPIVTTATVVGSFRPADPEVAAPPDHHTPQGD